MPKFDYVDHEFVPGTTHFLQLEKPEKCVAVMLDFLSRQGCER